jgi:hypothetical protein
MVMMTATTPPLNAYGCLQGCTKGALRILPSERSNKNEILYDDMSRDGVTAVNSFRLRRDVGESGALRDAPQVQLMLSFLLSLCHETAEGGDAVVRGGVRLCVLTSGIGFDGPKTEHIDAAAEARNHRYDVEGIHVAGPSDRGGVGDVAYCAGAPRLPNIRYRVAGVVARSPESRGVG